MSLLAVTLTSFASFSDPWFSWCIFRSSINKLCVRFVFLSRASHLETICLFNCHHYRYICTAKSNGGCCVLFRNPHLMFIYVIWSFSSFLCTSSLVFHLIIISVFAFITSSVILSFRIPSPSFQSSLSCALIIAISHSQIPVVLLDSTQDTIVHPKFIDCSQNVTTSTDEFLFHCCSKHCSPSDTLSYGWPICQ